MTTQFCTSYIQSFGTTRPSFSATATATRANSDSFVGQDGSERRRGIDDEAYYR